MGIKPSIKQLRSIEVGCVIAKDDDKIHGVGVVKKIGHCDSRRTNTYTIECCKKGNCPGMLEVAWRDKSMDDDYCPGYNSSTGSKVVVLNIDNKINNFILGDIE